MFKTIIGGIGQCFGLNSVPSDGDQALGGHKVKQKEARNPAQAVAGGFRAAFNVFKFPFELAFVAIKEKTRS